MKNLILQLLLFTAFTCNLYSETDNEITERVSKIAEALISGDYVYVIEMTHPPILEAMGGKEAAIAAVRAFMKTDAAKTLKVIKMEPKKPYKYVNGKKYRYVIVPFEYLVEIVGKRVSGSGYQLGVFEDASGEWKFVDGEKLNEEMFDKFFPDFPKTLKLPKIQKKLLD